MRLVLAVAWVLAASAFAPRRAPPARAARPLRAGNNKIEAAKPDLIVTGIAHVGVQPTVQWQNQQVPIAMTTGTWPWGPDWSDPRAQVIAEGYLQQWRDHADLASLRDLLEPARRMAILHRCESWRRLLDDAGELADDPSHPILRDHLVAATGERRP